MTGIRPTSKLLLVCAASAGFAPSGFAATVIAASAS
jgi:hypothetical protein